MSIYSYWLNPQTALVWFQVQRSRASLTKHHHQYHATLSRNWADPAATKTSHVATKTGLLVGGWPTPLKNMSSSVGNMTIHDCIILLVRFTQKWVKMEGWDEHICRWGTWQRLPIDKTHILCKSNKNRPFSQSQFRDLPCVLPPVSTPNRTFISMDWFVGKFAGKPHI